MTLERRLFWIIQVGPKGRRKERQREYPVEAGAGVVVPQALES